MLIDVDSRRTLKFSRKVEYKGDEVTIEIKYDKLFKYCTTCGMLSHEKNYCPSTGIKDRIQLPDDQSGQIERPGVFDRVQIPYDTLTHQLYTRQSYADDMYSRKSSLSRKNMQPQYSSSRGFSHGDRKEQRMSKYDATSFHSQKWVDNRRGGNHSDRIIRRRDEYSRTNRYGGSRYGKGPYDRNMMQSWREKPKDVSSQVKGNEDDGMDVVEARGSSQEIVPYEQGSGKLQKSGSHSRSVQTHDTILDAETSNRRRIASTIVTPSRLHLSLDDNVTVRNRVEGRSLTFSPLKDTELAHEDELIIEALNDMELMDQQDGEMLEADANDDDLLAADLMEIENKSSRSSARGHGERATPTLKKRHRSGAKRNVPLGIPNRKFEIIRRGSPGARSVSSGVHAKEEGSKRHRNASKTTKSSSSTYDGLMSSKNSSQKRQ